MSSEITLGSLDAIRLAADLVRFGEGFGEAPGPPAHTWRDSERPG